LKDIFYSCRDPDTRKKIVEIIQQMHDTGEIRTLNTDPIETLRDSSSSIKSDLTEMAYGILARLSSSISDTSSDLG
jgi:hypothetical protein